MATKRTGCGRVKVQHPKCPRKELFLEWLLEWQRAAEANSSDQRLAYSRAIRSLKRYPLPVESADQLLIIQNFGPKICSMLQRRYKEHVSHFGEPASKCSKLDAASASDVEPLSTNDMPGPSTGQRAKRVEPVAAKTTVSHVSCSRVNSDLILAPATTFSQSTTDDITLFSLNVKHAPKLVPIMDRKSWKYWKPTRQHRKKNVLLCVDTGETAGNHAAKKSMTSFLQKSGVNFDQRRLSVGDFVWVMQDDAAPGGLMTDYVVERKCADDLVSSIMDGRFHEQKNRMLCCAIPRPMYLVENWRSARRPEMLLTAVANTQIQDGFCVLHMNSMQDTSKLLASVTDKLSNGTLSENGFRSDDFPRDFASFQEAGAKNSGTTVRSLLAQQLMQIHGISAATAVAITGMFPTPLVLSRLNPDVVPKGTFPASTMDAVMHLFSTAC